MRDGQGQEGATAREYALMAALIAMVLFGAVAALGSGMRTSYECDGQRIDGLARSSPVVDVDC